MIYIYVWGNNEKRATMKGRTCRVLARGKMNSCLIQFIDNAQKEIVSKYAVRKCQFEKKKETGILMTGK